MRIVATPLTSGPVTPGKEQPGGRTWRWRGKPEGWPMDPATHDDRGHIEGPKGGAKVRAEERLKRTAEYGRLRDQGVPKSEAAERVGVERKTAARYEAAWKAGKGEAS